MQLQLINFAIAEGKQLEAICKWTSKATFLQNFPYKKVVDSIQSLDYSLLTPAEQITQLWQLGVISLFFVPQST